MKNLLTYISRLHEFNEEHIKLARIQIDNSLSLGWRPEDILLVTNFDYEYNGVKSTVIGDEHYCAAHWPATKVYVIDYLFKAGLIQEGRYWYHDFDCYQLVPFGPEEPDLGSADMGLTNYGRMPRLCSASMFFKETAGDIFGRLRDEVEKTGKDEEMGAARIIARDASFKERVKLLNITWAFHRFNLLSCDRIVDKPIRVAHFHLTLDKYDFYVKGINKLRAPLIPDRLIEIFNRHGFNENAPRSYQ